MSRVPLPERGQPLDLSYIYQIANAVNELAVQLSPTVGRYTSIDTGNAGTQSVRTSDARIVGGFVTVTNSSSTTSDGEASFSYNFTDFKFVPVVTATPILTSNVGTDASKDIVVVLTRITTNRVEGIVKFNTIGVTDVGVNLIAIGIPV
jgi:predicted TIM-barrel enzyme